MRVVRGCNWHLSPICGNNDGMIILNWLGSSYNFLHAEKVLARRHGNGSTDQSV